MEQNSIILHLEGCTNHEACPKTKFCRNSECISCPSTDENCALSPGDTKGEPECVAECMGTMLQFRFNLVSLYFECTCIIRFCQMQWLYIKVIEIVSGTIGKLQLQKIVPKPVALALTLSQGRLRNEEKTMEHTARNPTELKQKHVTIGIVQVI